MRALVLAMLPFAVACSSSPVSSGTSAAQVSVLSNPSVVPTGLIFRNAVSAIGAVTVTVDSEKPIVVSRIIFHLNSINSLALVRIEDSCDGKVLFGPVNMKTSLESPSDEIVFNDTVLLSPGKTTLIIKAFIGEGNWQGGEVLNLATNPNVDWEAVVPGVGPVSWTSARIVTSNIRVSGTLYPGLK